MLKIITNSTRLIIFFAALALPGCGVAEISIETLVNEFPRKQVFMDEVVQQCEKYTAIRRVGVEKDDVYLNKGYTSSNEIEAAVRLIRDQLIAISAQSTECLRRADYGHRLVAVGFTMWTVGISVSGVLRGYLYRTQWMETYHPLSEQARKEAGFIMLGVPGWYVTEID